MADEPDTYESEPAPVTPSPWQTRPRPRGRPRRLGPRPDVPFISTSPSISAQDTDDELISSIQLPSASYARTSFTLPPRSPGSETSEATETTEFTETTFDPTSDSEADLSASVTSLDPTMASMGASVGSLWDEDSESSSNKGKEREHDLGAGIEERQNFGRLQAENDMLRDEKDTLQEETAQLHDLLNAINGRLEELFDDPEVREALAEEDLSASATHTAGTTEGGHRRQHSRQPKPADMDNISYLVRIVNMVKNTARTRRWLREQGGPDQGILAAMNDLAGLNSPGSAGHGDFPPLGRRRASDTASLLAQTALSPRTMPGFRLAELLEAAGGRAANEEAVVDHDDHDLGEEDDYDEEYARLHGGGTDASNHPQVMAILQELQESLDRVTSERNEALLVAEKALQERDIAVAEKEQAEKEVEQLRQLLGALVDDSARQEDLVELAAADNEYGYEEEQKLDSSGKQGQNLLDEMADTEAEEDENSAGEKSPHLARQSSMKRSKSVRTSSGMSQKSSTRPALSRQQTVHKARKILESPTLEQPVSQPVPPPAEKQPVPQPPQPTEMPLTISAQPGVLWSLLDVLLSILEMVTIRQWHNLMSVGSWLLAVLAVPSWLAMLSKVPRPKLPKLKMKMPKLVIPRLATPSWMTMSWLGVPSWLVTPSWLALPPWMAVPLQSTAPSWLVVIVWLTASAWLALPAWLTIPSWMAWPALPAWPTWPAWFVVPSWLMMLPSWTLSRSTLSRLRIPRLEMPQWAVPSWIVMSWLTVSSWLTMPAWMGMSIRPATPEWLAMAVWLAASAWLALPAWLKVPQWFKLPKFPKLPWLTMPSRPSLPRPSLPRLTLPAWLSMPSWHTPQLSFLPKSWPTPSWARKPSWLVVPSWLIPARLIPAWLEKLLRKTDHWIQKTIQNYQKVRQRIRTNARPFPRDAVAQLLLFFLVSALVFTSMCALGERNIWLDHNADYPRTYLHHHLFQYRHNTGSWTRLPSGHAENTSPSDDVVSSFYWYIGIPAVIDPRLFIWSVTYYAAYWSDWALDLVHWLQLRW